MTDKTTYRTHFKCTACGSTVTSESSFEADDIVAATAKIQDLLKSSPNDSLVAPRMHVVSEFTAHIAYCYGVTASR